MKRRSTPEIRLMRAKLARLRRPRTSAAWPTTAPGVYDVEIVAAARYTAIKRASAGIQVTFRFDGGGEMSCWCDLLSRYGLLYLKQIGRAAGLVPDNRGGVLLAAFIGKRVRAHVAQERLNGKIWSYVSQVDAMPPEPVK